MLQLPCSFFASQPVKLGKGCPFSMLLIHIRAVSRGPWHPKALLLCLGAEPWVPKGVWEPTGCAGAPRTRAKWLWGVRAASSEPGTSTLPGKWECAVSSCTCIEGRENGSIYRNSAFFSLLSARLCRNIKPSLSV